MSRRRGGVFIRRGSDGPTAEMELGADAGARTLAACSKRFGPPPPPQYRSRCAPRAAVVYHGLMRSFRYLLCNHLKNMYGALASAGFVAETFAHTFTVSELSNARSREHAVALKESWRMLPRLRGISITDQNEFLRREGDFVSFLLTKARRASSYDDSTMRNMLCELESLRVATGLWIGEADRYRVVVYPRPDTALLDPLPERLLLQFAATTAKAVYVPEWEAYGGLNDRLAVGTPAALRSYGLRFAELASFAREHPVHAERLLLSAMQKANVWRWSVDGRPRSLREGAEGRSAPPVRAVRVRGDSGPQRLVVHSSDGHQVNAFLAQGGNLSSLHLLQRIVYNCGPGYQHACERGIAPPSE
eukprot:TRINITY_DN18879_c0_g1_i2.p1 TRINITY_DN18879_c0_g1~~TRINITY_DN18879_c0_g1_i2.p1  ORF type:complete len:361 (+),score=109.95 TRINITY_DN18879_c0_g1_i2:205-1287(+)